MLVKYLYQETSAAETLAVSEALQENVLLREEYLDLRKAYDQLPKVKFNAKPSTLQNILQYSKRSTALQGQD
ncbi:MAG TPA: hypothetical protein PLC89_00425 [Haliscomenobacter sp.]|nr:hypothetical protein [Haliscomenobacter sp.]